MGIALGVVISVCGYLALRRTLYGSLNPNRHEAVPTSSSGNLRLIVTNQSFEQPSAEILVEVEQLSYKTVQMRVNMKRLFLGSVPVKDQHFRVHQVFQLLPGRYRVIAHELHTCTVDIGEVEVPESGVKYLIVSFGKSADDYLSPYPYFTIEQSLVPPGFI